MKRPLQPPPARRAAPRTLRPISGAPRAFQPPRNLPSPFRPSSAAASSLPAWFFSAHRPTLASSGGFYTLPLDLVAIPAEFAACAILAIARDATLALHRAYRVREAASVASVLGAPSPADLAAAWPPSPRPVPQALRIGAMLADLAAIHPAAPVLSTAANTASPRVRGRAPGLKGYLAATLPSIPYSTAMRYKKLAQRTAAALALPPGLPLQWILSDASPAALSPDPASIAAIHRARRALASLLAANPSQRAFARAVERSLGIERLSLRADLATTRPHEAAARDALLARYERRLSAAVASGRPLSRPEKRAASLLDALRRALE